MENAKIEYLKHFKISNNFIFYLHSVSDKESQKLNYHYFNKNLPADVITVPLYRNLEEINKLDKNENEILGDLFLNRNLIKENAFKYKKTLVEEFQLVLIHGLLHLVGFSHKEEDKLTSDAFASVILKHNNPCGASLSNSASQAFLNALE